MQVWYCTVLHGDVVITHKGHWKGITDKPVPCASRAARGQYLPWSIVMTSYLKTFISINAHVHVHVYLLAIA